VQGCIRVQSIEGGVTAVTGEKRKKSGGVGLKGWGNTAHCNITTAHNSREFERGLHLQGHALTEGVLDTESRKLKKNKRGEKRECWTVKKGGTEGDM